VEQDPSYSKHVDLIGKDEFIRLFSTEESPGQWFTKSELADFPFNKHHRSLAARYLIKKRIARQLGVDDIQMDIEILDNTLGKPELKMGQNVRQAAEKAGVKDILCSISHSRNYITGMTIFIFE
jgi:holo-[acyl-carrier protein] synthase